MGHQECAPRAAENHDEIKYAAFISYRHLPRDQEVARKVQSFIEGYKLPSGAVVSSGDSRTLGKCFRDEDELSVTHSLPESIKNALARSGALIVICSPEANDSEWVQREIKEYVDLHGRERVFAVLASGDSASSIPSTLKDAPVFDDDGVCVHEGNSPLAADMRSESKKEQGAELLRIVAALAGCDYDDLRQRERSRRRRRMAIGISGAIALFILIAALVFFGVITSEAYKVSESESLAAQSRQALAEGDRMQALRLALDALPSSSVDASRPIVDDAEVALQDAMQVNPDPTGIWRPSYVLDVPGNVVSFTSSVDDGWVAVLDDSSSVSVFDTKTGAKRFSTTLEKAILCNSVTDEDLDVEHPECSEYGILAAGANSLLVFSRTGRGDFACIDVVKAEARWSYENARVSAIAVSQDGLQVAVISVFEDDGIMTGLIDVRTGKLLGSGDYDNLGIMEVPYFYPATLDSQKSRASFGVAGHVITVDFDQSVLRNTKVNDQLISSMVEKDGMLALVSSYADKEAMKDGIFMWRAARVNDVEPIWQVGGEYEIAALGTTTDLKVVDLYPKARCILPYDGPAVAITAGNQLHVFSLSDGKELLSNQFSSEIVGLGHSYSETGRDMITTITADGRIGLIISGVAAYLSDSYRTQLPFNVAEASAHWYCGEDYLVMLKNLDPSNKLYVYRLDSRLPVETQDYSLDELVAGGREILEVNQGGDGRTELVNQPELLSSK